MTSEDAQVDLVPAMLKVKDADGNTWMTLAWVIPAVTRDIAQKFTRRGVKPSSLLDIPRPVTVTSFTLIDDYPEVVQRARADD